jgi:hypothetical protein
MAGPDAYVLTGDSLRITAGGLVFEGGVIDSPAGGSIRPFTPLLGCPQPSGGTTFASSYPASTVRFPCPYSRETWSVTLSRMKIGEI